MAAATAVVVLVVLGTLGLALGAPANMATSEKRESMGAETTDVCYPHLIYPNGSRMTADIQSHYAARSCLDSMLLTTLSDKGAVLRELFKRSGATIYCRGLVHLLSLVEAYGWTDSLCERPLVDREQHFCDPSSLSRQVANFNGAVGKLDGMNYRVLSAVARQMLSTLALGKCSEICVGPIGSALCGTFFDVTTFLVSKYEGGESQCSIMYMYNYTCMWMIWERVAPVRKFGSREV